MKGTQNSNQELNNPETQYSSDLEALIPASTSNKKFRCDECSKLFSSKQCLKEHTYSHINAKPYVCGKCNKCFRHASQFTLHKKTHVIQPNVVWPKLTDLIKGQQKPRLFRLEPMEKINLPLVGPPQEYILPSIQELIFRLKLV